MKAPAPKSAPRLARLSRPGGSIKAAASAAAATRPSQPPPPRANSNPNNPKPDRPPTPFERAVYAVCAAIPRGRVGTYGGLSAALGRGSARAVGQAMRKNPFAPRVPCHRVIAASRAIGGFAGEAGPPGGGGGGGGMTTAGGHVARKRAMLRGEGVRFESDEPGEAGYWAVARACVLSTDEMAALVLAARAAADGGGEEEEEEDGGGVGGG